MKPHRFDELDFQVFLVQLLCSLTPSVPLDLNLRAVMAPLLHRLMRYTGAEIGAHLFVNTAMKELHVIALGADPEAYKALREELKRRHRPVSLTSAPDHRLPEYVKLIGNATVEKKLEKEGVVEVKGALLEALKQIAPTRVQNCEPGQALIVPLQFARYQRLGVFILWAPGTALQSWYDSWESRDTLAGFRRSVQTLLVRLFSNFYQMGPDTYLPSYYHPGEKAVAVLCCEIREFDSIVEVMHRRRDLDEVGASDCLQKLVADFTRTFSEYVTGCKGRVDQLWGNGALAVFGEYVDTAAPHEIASCMRALECAKRLVLALKQDFDKWLHQEFKASSFRRMNDQHVNVEAVVTCTYGNVRFDYAGSPEHPIYMAIGDRITFAKQLTAVAATSDFHHAELRRRGTLQEFARFGTGEEGGDLRNAPILLSQSVVEWAAGLFKDTKDGPGRNAREPHYVLLPGRSIVYPIYAAWPENIMVETRRPGAD